MSDQHTKLDVPLSNNEDHHFADDVAALQADDQQGPSATTHSKAANRHKDHNGNLITVQPLKRSEMQPSYAQDFGTDSPPAGFYASWMNGLGNIAGGLGQLPCCFCCPNPFKEVQQGTVGLISRFGSVVRAVDPGLVNVNPCSESLKTVDIKIQLSSIPSQSVFTKDNVNVKIDSVIYWSVTNPYRAIFAIQDIRQSLIERGAVTLRDVVGSRPLQSLISDREGVALQVEEIVESVAEKWGVAIESILIKDIIFSRELQESLSSAATQTRIGQSKVILARAEVESARLMRQAADILSSPAALQIRELEALQSMSKNAGSKVIFVPMNLGSGQVVQNGGTSSTTAGASTSGGGGEARIASLEQLANM